MTARSFPAAGKRAALAALARLPDPERFLLIADDDDEEGFDMDVLFRDDLLQVEDV